MTALPRLSFILPSSGLLTMACTHLMIEVTALPTTSSCDGPPSAGCAKGLWNEKECRCNCIPPFCTDFNGVCSADAASCGGSTVVSWEKCVPGIDCPWWASILGEESCTTGSEIPPGIWDIYNSQEECCNTKFSHSSTCKDVRILPRQLQDDIVECTTDQDCYPRIRSRKPTLIPFTKVDMCECYADSNIVPFDECEGEGDDTCPISKCAGDACEESSAVCDTNAGVCDLNVSLSTTNSTEADRNVTVAETASTFVTEPTKPAEVQCTQDAECIPIIRKSVPSSNTQLVGVELCSCYVQSSLEPLFDECQGEDETTCQMTENSIITCDVMACDEKEGYCNTEGGGGVCELRELEVDDEDEGNGGVNATAIATACNTSDDCFPTMRDRIPLNQDVIGVGSCGCYSDSKIDPFDECQGEEEATCPTASCFKDSCMMKEAVCDGDLGVCVLEETVPDISGIVAGDDDTNATTASTAATAVNATETASFETNSDTMTTDPTKSIVVQCTQDAECIPIIRKSIPSPDTPLIGVELCSCYVQSSLEPLFDECQGEDETTCQMTENSIIACDVMACDEKEGYCNTEGGGGVCELRELDVGDEEEGDGGVNATAIATACNTSDDCFPTMRDRVPSNQDVIGVGSCGCYSDSKIDPFDECQGEEDATCATASCVEDSCMMKEAVCDGDLGVCVLEETVPDISGIVAGDDDTNFTATSTAATAVNATETASFETNSDTMTTDPTKPAMVQCTQDSECIPTIRKSIPSPSTPLVGVELCTCYVQSSLEPLFDECQGEDETTCQMTENSIITCDVMACDGLEGYCNVESGNGICELLELGIPDDEVDSSVNATVIATVCNTSNDCFPTMRDRVPSNQDVIGVGSCGCYSDSKIDPFDECQGEEDATCATASCVEDSCMTKKAVCDDDLGVCVLEETVPEISEIVAGDDEGTTLTSSTLTAGTEAVTETSSTAGTTYSTNQPGVSEIGDDIKESDEGEVEGVGSTVTSTTSKSTVSAASVSTTTSTESPISEVGDEAADGDVMDMSPFTDISSSTMVMLGSASTMIVSGNIFLLAGFAAYVVVGFVTL